MSISNRELKDIFNVLEAQRLQPLHGGISNRELKAQLRRVHNNTPPYLPSISNRELKVRPSAVARALGVDVASQIEN